MARLYDTETQLGRGRSPLDIVAQHALRVSQTCDLLEALADDLPRRSEPVWREASRMCADVIPRHYRDVLDVLVPILLRRTQGERDCETILLKLRADFEYDACRLTELNDLFVDTLGGNRRTIGAEALGYALRGFFDVLRRNTSWETDVLLPLASRRLTDQDLGEIAQQLSSPGYGRI